MTLASLFVDTTSSSMFFDVVLILLWSLVIDSNFMLVSLLVLELWQFSLIRDWLEIPEIANTPIWVLPNIWRLRRVRDTKFGTNVSNGMLLNAGKCQDYSLYCYWVISGKPAGVRQITPFSPTQIKIKAFNYFAKRSILDVWRGTNCTSASVKWLIFSHRHMACIIY